MRNLFIACFGLAVTTSAHSQNCATPPPSTHHYNFVRDVVSQIDVTSLRNAGTTCVPLQAHFVLLDNGSGGITQLELNRGLSFLNYYFLNAGIEFFWKGPPDYANNTDYYDYNEQAGDNDTESTLVGLFPPAMDAVNIYFVNSGIQASGFQFCGFAYYPGNSAVTNRIVMVYSCMNATPNGTFVHEFGHYFDLFHTHEGTEFGNTHAQAENVPRTGMQANCTTKGDLLCGTHADPKGTPSNCVYSGGSVSTTDINGVPYTPPVENIMSYYWPNCGGPPVGFTSDQYTRMTQGLLTRLGHTQYSLTAPPGVTNAPSQLTVGISANAVVLNWMDISGDLGYLIERSTVSASTGFQQLLTGYTDIDATLYSDGTALSNTTYYYRVKPTNGDCNTYSNVVSITTGLQYCIPYYATSCDAGVPMVIDEFQLTGSGSTISNVNSNCSAGSYGDFTGMNASVTAGMSHSVIARAVSTPPGGSFYPQDVGMWADWNHDGDFSDVGETLLPANTTMWPNCVTSIAVPASALNGPTRLRVRTCHFSDDGTLTACNATTIGETEDYTVTVTGGINPTVQLAVKLWLEGPLVSGASILMHDSLRVLGLIPSIEPYTTGLGFSSVSGGGGEMFTSGVLSTTGPNAIVDWVRIELRSGVDPTVLVATRQCLLQRDGDVVDTDGTSNVILNVLPGSYYVTVRHRNHLGIMSSAPLGLSGAPTLIDFRNPATPTYGAGGRKAIGADMALWAGNALLDGAAPFKLMYVGNGNDRDPILVDVGGSVPTNVASGYLISDCNMDGKVKYVGEGNDRDLILQNIGGSVPTAIRVEQLP